jgi:TolC family type I secretion outer membrane protein
MNIPRLLLAVLLMAGLPLPAQASDVSCVPPDPHAPLTLADAVQQAFCRNPQTRQWWATVGSQEAQLKQAKAAYWPQLSSQYQVSRNRTQYDVGSSDVKPQTLSLTASYMLYDFGGRSAAARLAEAQLQAAIATRDSDLNTLTYQVAQAYLDTLLAQESLKAAGISERSAEEALKAAEAKLAVGSAIPATRLQAQTAYSQAQLARIKADGTLSTSQARLATLMGLPPDTGFELASWQVARGKAEAEGVASLIERALENRSDLAAAREQIKAAEASLDAARADGMPNIALAASAGRQTNAGAGNATTQSMGLTVSVPIFTGYRDTYRIKGAEADLEGRRAAESAMADQVRLDVWNAYQNLKTNIDAMRSARDAVASGDANEQVQLGRFKAGVGTMLDVLSAQASATTARQQLASAEHDYLLGKFMLAQALGRLNYEPLPSIGE